MEEKLRKLEETVAFQDDLIERLNATVGEQQIALHRLTERFEKLEDHIRSIQPSVGQAVKDETPPPHY